MKRKTYILGSGPIALPRPGVVYVDLRPFPGVSLTADLEKTPWPIPDGGAIHANATHVLEHITNFHDFMDEAWRILHPGGTLLLEVPNVMDRLLAFSDPTHVRYFTKHTFVNYLTVEGVHRHGQFRHAWCFLHLEDTGSVIRAHLMPVPDEALTDETITMWKKYKNEESHDREK